MINRSATATLKKLATWYPAVALTGPRQAGKTTLAQTVFPGKPYRSLEDPDQREFALSDPRGFLAQFPDGAILDEVQRSPELFSYLQTRLDADRRMGLFILTGSQQFSLNENISQSLAGRVGYLHLLPFTHGELLAGFAPKNLEAMLLQGFYPPMFDRGITPHVWYADYVATYIERDLRQLINVRDLAAFQRFLRMCAARWQRIAASRTIRRKAGFLFWRRAIWWCCCHPGIAIWANGWSKHPSCISSIPGLQPGWQACAMPAIWSWAACAARCLKPGW